MSFKVCYSKLHKNSWFMSTKLGNTAHLVGVFPLLQQAAAASSGLE